MTVYGQMTSAGRLRDRLSSGPALLPVMPFRQFRAVDPQVPCPMLHGLSAPIRMTTMNWDRIEGKWKQLTGLARERWGKFTDDDIQTLTGQKNQLVGKIQERYGIPKAEAEEQAEIWSRALSETSHENPATRL